MNRISMDERSINEVGACSTIPMAANHEGKKDVSGYSSCKATPNDSSTFCTRDFFYDLSKYSSLNLTTITEAWNTFSANNSRTKQMITSRQKLSENSHCYLAFQKNI